MPIYGYGKYKVTVKVANTNTVLTGEINIQKEYEVETVSTHAYLKNKNTAERTKIEKAYVYINNEKKDVSNYLINSGDYNYLNYGQLYADGITNMEVPFEIELIDGYNASAKLIITEQPVS